MAKQNLLLTNARYFPMTSENGLAACLGTILIENGHITQVGQSPTKIPKELALEEVNCHGALVTPGLIDCHTHLIYVGSRAHEWQSRQEGATYEDITNSGGGIASTIASTHDASDEQLIRDALRRLDVATQNGVTTIEIKSGYGQDMASEFRLLRLCQKLQTQAQQTIVPTYLCAHACPQAYQGRHEDYLTQLLSQAIPEAWTSGLCEAIDVYCDSIAFDVTFCEAIFKKAHGLGLPFKCHGEQLSHTNIAALAAKWGALSVDHLEHVSDAGIHAMASHGTIGVLLPGAYYYLKSTTPPPIAQLREAGVSLALATDANPGTSPVFSLLMAMNLGIQLFDLTLSEVWLGVTRYAAMALGAEQKIGTIEVGKQADLVIWQASDLAEIVYPMGMPIQNQIIKQGELVNERENITER